MTKTTSGESRSQDFSTTPIDSSSTSQTPSTNKTISPSLNNPEVRMETRNNLNVTPSSSSSSDANNISHTHHHHQQLYSSNSNDPHHNQNHHPTHCRTYSHPLTLLGGSSGSGSGYDYEEYSLGALAHPSTSSGCGQPPSSCSLTDILNLDFVNIPPTNSTLALTLDLKDKSSSNGAKAIPGEIPASVMRKYLTDDCTNNNAEVIQDILVDLGAVQSTSEIAKVLDNFNAILERIEREEGEVEESKFHSGLPGSSPASSSGGGSGCGSSSRIKNSVEAFADLLLSGGGDEEDEDLLIIVDENESDSLPHEPSSPSGQRSAEEEELEQEEMNDLCPSLDGDRVEEDLEDFEGYESDRPMVRASMRKLRPLKIKPLPPTVVVSSSNQEEPYFQTPSAPPATPRSPSPDNYTGLATTLNSPSTNKILVTSLVNSVLSSTPTTTCESEQRQLQGASSSSGSVSVSVCNTEGQGQPCASGSGGVDSSTRGTPPSSTTPINISHSRSQSNSSSQLLTVITINNNNNETVVNSNPAGVISDTNTINNNTTTTLNETRPGSSSTNLNNNSNSNSNNGNNNASSTSSPSSNSNNGSSNNNNGDDALRLNGGNPTSPTTTDSSRTTTTNSNANSTSTSTTTSSTTGTSSTTSITTTTTTSPSTATTTTGGTSASSGSTGTTRAGRRGGGQGSVIRVPAGRWPHRLSSVLALIGCTLGLNNICRFALLSVQYGANFILQFVFLSFVFGIPLLTFHMSIGQYLSSGIIDMWKISPIFQGIGVGLMISQALIGLYTAVGVSWMFIYFRDSFVTRSDQYRWGKCVREFRDCDPYGYNQTVELEKTVPDYFNGVVLQRSSPDYPNSAYVPSSLKFTVAFNLAVVWMLVFVSLSKGLKSYGKVVHGFVLAPVAALFVLAFKMVGLVETGSTLFGQTAWSEFFFNSQTWVVAAREAFFTWGLLGACVMQVTAHNRHSHPLKSDAVIVIMVTTVVLLLSAFIGNTCLSVVTAAQVSPQAQAVFQQYSYVPSSFESERTYKFLDPDGHSKSHEIPDISSHYYNHNPFLMGVRILKPDYVQDHTRSGYQVLRLATELFPSAMAILSPSGLSPFWTVLFYFTLVLFGIAQQLAIWHCVIKGIIAIKAKVLRSWETTITFFVCGLGFVLGLPLCTETGIFVTYFLDFAIGSGWWIMILYLLELVAVFIVRGAPYCGENIVTVLITGPGRLAKILAPLVSFIWNVIMPVALLVLAIASFKSGNIRELYDWNPKRGYSFWPSWTREVGSLIQLLPILAVPFVAIIQSCRFLANGQADLFERMQQLYRPNTRFGSSSTTASSDGRTSRNGSSLGRSEDPPPKYTPPPSYSTATGAKIARFLRNSFRRSLRRISSPGGPSPSTSTSDHLPPPPNYASVILEINAQRAGLQNSSCANNNTSDGNGIMIPVMIPPPPEYDEATQSDQKSEILLGAEGGYDPDLDLSSTTPNIKSTSKGLYQIHLSQTLGRSLGEGSKERASLRRIASDITPRDIARMLRASFRRPSNTNPPPNNNTTVIDIESQPRPSTSDFSDAGITFIASPALNLPSSYDQPGPSSVQVPPYTFSRNSLEKIDYDLDMLTQLEAASRSNSHRHEFISGTSAPSSTYGLGGFGFDPSRNRHSNDSQLALISSGCYDLGAMDNEAMDLSLSNNMTLMGSGPLSSTSVQLHHHPSLSRTSNLLTLGIVSNPSSSSNSSSSTTFHLQNALGSQPPHSEA